MSDSLRVVRSDNLDLYAANAELIRKDLAGGDSLAEALGVEVPETWPPDLYGSEVMRITMAQLQTAPGQGWSFWYLATQDEPSELAGICGFKARPDSMGSVEISYSILAPFRNRGFATEAVQKLVDWAFAHHNVSEVSAETLPHLRQSIRVLEKNGFQRDGAGSETGVIRYVVKRSWLN